MRMRCPVILIKWFPVYLFPDLVDKKVIKAYFSFCSRMAAFTFSGTCSNLHGSIE